MRVKKIRFPSADHSGPMSESSVLVNRLRSEPSAFITKMSPELISSSNRYAIRLPSGDHEPITARPPFYDRTQLDNETIHTAAKNLIQARAQLQQEEKENDDDERADLMSAPCGSASSRRRAFVHARHLRASLSLVCAESLNAAADSIFPQDLQIFLRIILETPPQMILFLVLLTDGSVDIIH